MEIIGIMGIIETIGIIDIDNPFFISIIDLKAIYIAFISGVKEIKKLISIILIFKIVSISLAKLAK